MVCVGKTKCTSNKGTLLDLTLTAVDLLLFQVIHHFAQKVLKVKNTSFLLSYYLNTSQSILFTIWVFHDVYDMNTVADGFSGGVQGTYCTSNPSLLFLDQSQGPQGWGTLSLIKKKTDDRETPLFFFFSFDGRASLYTSFIWTSAPWREWMLVPKFNRETWILELCLRLIGFFCCRNIQKSHELERDSDLPTWNANFRQCKEPDW